MTPPLIEIVNVCIDRLAAGETIEDCVRDYPDYADELRDMLGIGTLIGQLSPSLKETQLAQQRSRQQLASRMQEEKKTMMMHKPKRKRTQGRAGLLPMGIAALIALVAGIGIGVVGMQMSTVSSVETVADPNVQLGPIPTMVPVITATPFDFEAIRPVYRPTEFLPTVVQPDNIFVLEGGLDDEVITSSPYIVTLDVVFPGQMDENVRISSVYSSSMPDLGGWTLSDDDGNSYTIPQMDAEQGVNYISIYTKAGIDDGQNFYMGFVEPIWQLDDLLTLTEPERGLTYRIRVEDSIESPWHLGDTPTPAPTVPPQDEYQLTATAIINDLTATAQK